MPHDTIPVLKSKGILGQDATFGIGEPSLPDSETSIDEEEARDTLSPLPGEAVPEVEDEIDGEDILMDAYVPDFRLLLQAIAHFPGCYTTELWCKTLWTRRNGITLHIRPSLVQMSVMRGEMRP